MQRNEKYKYVYYGEFVGGYLQGFGITMYVSGDVHVGQYKDGLRNGEGTYFYPDGDRWEGSFKDGKFHGEGVYTRAGKKENRTYDMGTWV